MILDDFLFNNCQNEKIKFDGKTYDIKKTKNKIYINNNFIIIIKDFYSKIVKLNFNFYDEIDIFLQMANIINRYYKVEYCVCLEFDIENCIEYFYKNKIQYLQQFDYECKNDYSLCKKILYMSITDLIQQIETIQFSNLYYSNIYIRKTYIDVLLMLDNIYYVYELINIKNIKIKKILFDIFINLKIIDEKLVKYY